MKALRFVVMMLILSLLTTGTAFSATATVNSLTALETAIFNAFQAKDNTLNITYTGSGKDITKVKLGTALSNALKKEDYVHYTVKSYGYSYVVPSTGSSTINFTNTYWESAAQVAAVAQKSQEVIASEITAGMNPHLKIKKLHDWIVLNFAYDTTLKEHSAYAGVSAGLTVCQGYALMMYRLLKDAGFEARIIEGKAGKQLHAWNMVKVSNKWYHIDPTWDDPVPNKPGQVQYGYYMLTDAQIKKDHAPTTKGYSPAVTNYDTELLSLISSDPSNASTYTSIMTAIGLDYVKTENTITTVAQLKTKILSMISTNSTNLNVRYMRKSTIKADLALAFKGTGKGYAYSIADYSRTVTTSDGILTLTIK